MNIGLYQNFFMLIRTYQLKEHQHTWLIYWLYLIHKEFWLCYLYKDQIGLLFISFFSLVDCSPFFLLLLFFPSEVFSMYTNFIVHGYSHSYIFYVFCRYCLNKKFFSICIWRNLVFQIAEEYYLWSLYIKMLEGGLSPRTTSLYVYFHC